MRPRTLDMRSSTLVLCGRPRSGCACRVPARGARPRAGAVGRCPGAVSARVAMRTVPPIVAVVLAGRASDAVARGRARPSRGGGVASRCAETGAHRGGRSARAVAAGATGLAAALRSAGGRVHILPDRAVSAGARNQVMLVSPDLAADAGARRGLPRRGLILARATGRTISGRVVVVRILPAERVVATRRTVLAACLSRRVLVLSLATDGARARAGSRLASPNSAVDAVVGVVVVGKVPRVGNVLPRTAVLAAGLPRAVLVLPRAADRAGGLAG